MNWIGGTGGARTDDPGADAAVSEAAVENADCAIAVICCHILGVAVDAGLRAALAALAGASSSEDVVLSPFSGSSNLLLYSSLASSVAARNSSS